MFQIIVSITYSCDPFFQYRNELLQLDKMPSEQVTKLEASCYAEEARILRIAEKASRKIMELERLTYRLLKAFTPPEPKSSRGK